MMGEGDPYHQLMAEAFVLRNQKVVKVDHQVDHREESGVELGRDQRH